MKSPITGKEMKLVIEKDVIEFRKETFEVNYHYYSCEDSGETFTNEDLDTKNVTQAYNQYREKHKIPFPDAIKAIRNKYGIAASKMSEILGFGINVYRQYEAGEVPSVSNARLIQLISDPEEFKKLVEVSQVFEGKQYEEIMQKIDSLIKQKQSLMPMVLHNYLMHGLYTSSTGIYTGYKTSNLNKLIEMVVFFAEKVRPWKTKLNKLLFYADFVHFKRTCFSISGAEYIAIQMGPVPRNFSSIFEFASQNKDVHINFQEFPNGGIGEQFIPYENRKFNKELFEESELKALEDVARAFKTMKTQEIIEKSHQESAWVKNLGDMDGIKYDDAFLLQYIN